MLVDCSLKLKACDWKKLLWNCEYFYLRATQASRHISRCMLLYAGESWDLGTSSAETTPFG